MEIFEDNTIVDFDDYDIELPFAGNLKDSFLKIEEIIRVNKIENLKMQILKNIVGVVDCLATFGNVHEQIVFDTAQIYVLMKYTAINESKIKGYFGDISIAGAKIMVENFENFEVYLKNIFENEEYRYLAKIKIADYIFEINQKTNNTILKKQAREIIKRYGDKSQKGLINKLKEIAG